MTWALGAALAEVDRGEQWTPVRVPLGALAPRFVLDLATTRVRHDQAPIAIPGGGTTAAVEIDLGQVLPAAAGHSGRDVQAAFAKISKAVEGDPP
jgi:hypothetical protein